MNEIEGREKAEEHRSASTSLLNVCGIILRRAASVRAEDFFTWGREFMISQLRSVLAALVCAALSACAATSALESQNKPLTARVARIYILRPGALPGAAMSANVR